MRKRLCLRDFEELAARVHAPRGKRRVNCALRRESVGDFRDASDRIFMHMPRVRVRLS